MIESIDITVLTNVSDAINNAVDQGWVTPPIHTIGITINGEHGGVDVMIGGARGGLMMEVH